jgi:hypothetical protein
MILPTRHITTNASLIAIGALILANLGAGPRSVNDVWVDLRDETGVVTFDRFCLAVTFLYTLGIVEQEGNRLRRLNR